MDIKNNFQPQINNLDFKNPVGGSNNNVGAGTQGGPTFKDTLDKLQQAHLQGGLTNHPPPNGLQTTSGIKFSNHAVERMRTRGVNFTKEQMDKLGNAVQKAAAKGSKDSLVLMDDTALIVSVKNNTVVTVVDKSSLKENVFTNIDSTIVV